MTCFKYYSRGLPTTFFPDIAPSRMFTTNSLCLIIHPVHEWRLFFRIFKSNLSSFALWQGYGLNNWRTRGSAPVRCGSNDQPTSQWVSEFFHLGKTKWSGAWSFAFTSLLALMVWFLIKHLGAKNRITGYERVCTIIQQMHYSDSLLITSYSYY
jgi:hypothetical protein